MTRLSYTKALHSLLIPVGFTREKSMWSRVTGEILEQVDLQKSWIDGAVTVNMWAENLETDRIVRTIPCKHGLYVQPKIERIGRIVDGPMSLDRWWKNNPDGPVEVASLVRDHGLPWFSKVTTLEDEALFWYGRGKLGTWNKGNLAALAVTLCRLGELDEALKMFDEPIPRMAEPIMVEMARCVQRWLEEQKRQREASGAPV